METLKARRRFLLLSAGFSLFFVGSASGKIAPDSGRRTFHTAHFRVHYPLHYRVFAEALADRLEDAHLLLHRDLGWTPSGKIEVVVRGDTDFPNGAAEVFPYNRLVLNAVAPEAWGFFSESDDWIRTLAIHELTHVIANDETSGLFRILRPVVGSAAKVNPYQPAWLVEGLAVYEETLKTARGRGRSTWNAMVVRTSVLDSLLESGEDGLKPFRITLDRLNDGVRPWPGDHAAYLYGYLLTAEAASRGGADAPARISSANSANLPFAIDRVAREVIGMDYAGLWKDLLRRLRVDEEKDLARIAEEAITPHAFVTRTGRRTRGFAATDASRFFFIRDSEREGVGLSVMEGGTERNLNTWRWDGGTRVRFTPDGKYLLYSRIAPYLDHSLFSDLYLYDPATGQETALTSGARAADPEPSPDFAWDPVAGRIARGSVIGVKNLGDGNQAIAAFRRGDGGKSEGVVEELLYAGQDFERLGAPAYGPGGIVFSAKGLAKGERIRILDPKTGNGGIRDVTAPDSDRSIATTPEWDRDGGLLYVGGEGGVFNARKIPRDEIARRDPRSERITNFRTGALQPTRPYAGAPLYAMVYSGGGWDLARIQPGKFSGKGPGVEDLTREIVGEPAADPPSGATGVAPAARTEAGNSVLPALWPKYWAPDVRKIADGWTLGARTSNYDAWEDHRYRLFGGRDTRADFPVWDFNYRYDGFHPTLEFSLRRENRYFATYRESNQIDTDEARVYMPAGWDSSVLLGFTNSTSRLFGEKESTGGFQIGWVLDRMRVYDDSIDAAGESGLRGQAELTGYFAGRERFSAFDARIDARIPSPFRRHFFRLGANYAAANNDRLSALYFLGGGEETIADRSDFLLRGYPQGTAFGRRILTSNLEYVFPLVDVFRGPGTFPAYFERSRFKLFFDAGSAEYVGNDARDFRRWPCAIGAHLLGDFNFLYRVPVTVAIGFDRGLARDLGGESRVVFGLFSRLK